VWRFLYIFLIPFWAMFPVAVLGVREALLYPCRYLVVFPWQSFISRTPTFTGRV
jgi:hypothetical protein